MQPAASVRISWHNHEARTAWQLGNILGLVPPMLPAVLQMGEGDLVTRRLSKPGYPTIVHVEHVKVVCYVDPTVVEQTVMVRTQAKDVLGDVGALVWLSQPANVRALNGRAAGDGQLQPADLACAVVALLDPLRYLCAANDSGSSS